MTPDSRSIAEKEKQNAAASSVVAAVFLTALKLVVGLLTGSLGILSEAAHSGLDMVAALVTFFAVRFSDQPPDAEHPYGHGKIENLSALIETLLLLLTCVWIMYEAVQRLFFKSVEVQASVWAFAVMVISIVVDVSRSRVLYAAARKYDSQALEADALHFSTDIWSSLTVIFGLALVRLGHYLGPDWEWLAKADAVAALGVALIVVYVSVQLGREAIAVLLDAAPPGLVERIGAEALRVAGVQSVGPVRVRRSGALTFADLSVGVDRAVSLEQAHLIAATVESRIVALIPRGDIVVHVDPLQRRGEGLPQAVSAIAARLGLQTHNIRAREVRGDYYVDLHVETPALMTLGQAHEQVSRLEAALYDELPHVKEVNSHIEPLVTGSPLDVAQETNAQERLRAQIMALVELVPELCGCYNVRIWPGREGYEVVLHCVADPEMSVEEAHRLADQVERLLQTHAPGVSQVLVHIEPEEDSETLID